MLQTSPEFNLVLKCSASTHSPEDLKQIQCMLSDSPDFDLFVKLIVKHRLYGPVFRTIDRFFKRDIPVETLLRIKSLHQRNILKSLNNIGEMLSVSKAFNDQAIDHLFLKGACLSKILYGDPSFRHAGDIDLIMPENNIPEAMSILETYGYRQVQSQQKLTNRTMPIFKENSHHLKYINARQTAIELHWRFSTVKSDYPISFEEAYAGRRYIQINGTAMPVLGEIYTLLFLFYHGTRHDWQRLFWLKDLADYIQSTPRFNSAPLFQMARQYNLQGYLYESFFLLQAYYGIQWPGFMETDLANDHFITIIAQIPRILYATENKAASILLKHIHRFLLKQTIKGKISYVKEIIESKKRKKLFHPDHKSEFLQAVKAWLF